MAGWVDKSALVEQVKQWQRKGATHKQAWDNYCMENGHQKFDPNMKDETFLQSFLDGCTSGAIVPMEGGGWGGWGGAAAATPMQSYGDHSSMVEQVKQWQRKSAAHKQAWDNFCMEQGHQKFDPNMKDETFLQTFMQGTTSGTIVPDESGGWSGASGGGWWGGGGGKGNKGNKGSKGGKGGKGGWGGGGSGGKGGWGGGGGGGDDWWGMDPWSMMMSMKGGKGSGGGANRGGPSHAGADGMGEVRYEGAEYAQQAVEWLNGSPIKGSEIGVELDAKSKDGTKVVVSGLPVGLSVRELKEHFTNVGPVAFAGFKDSSSGGGGGGGWGYSPW